MRTLVQLGLALTLVWTLAATAGRGEESKKDKGSKIDISGTWEFEVDLGGNSGMPVFTFKQNGDALTGKYKGQLGEADVTGKVKGDKIEFSFETSQGKATYSGTIDKDTMKGKANYGDQLSGTFTGKRKKDK
jgi:hypothetical protein